MTAGEGSVAERAAGAAGASGDDAAPSGDTAEHAPGEPSAQARIEALNELATRPLAEHPADYERLHADLRAALAEIDDA